MPYANLLTLPSAFPLPEVEQTRRACISRSLICLGLCLVFIVTVSLAPVGSLGRHFTDGVHTYLERRQVPTAEPRGGFVDQPSQDTSRTERPATVFLTAGWDGPQQGSAVPSSEFTAQPSKIIEPAPGTFSPTATIARGQPTLSFITDDQTEPSTTKGRHSSARTDYPSLNPSIGAHVAEADVDEADSLFASQPERTWTREQGDGPLSAPHDQSLANSGQTPASIFSQPVQGFTATVTSEVESLMFGSGSSPMFKYPLPLLGQSNDVNEAAASLLIEAQGPTSLHHAKSQNEAYVTIDSQQSPNSRYTETSKPGDLSLWNGPLPGDRAPGASQPLQSVAPLPASPTGTQTTSTARRPDQAAPDLQCLPCAQPVEAVHGDDSGATGPCSGQGFRCDECLNGWFCPPQETPAQVLSCGLGWPCFHCSSGSFCIPDTALAENPVEEDGLPAPASATGPSPPGNLAPLSPGQISPPPVKALPTPPAEQGPAGPSDQTLVPDTGTSSGALDGPNPPSVYDDTQANPQPPPQATGNPSPEKSEVLLFPHEEPLPAPDSGHDLPAPVSSHEGYEQPSSLSPGPDTTRGGLPWNYVGCFQDDVRRALVGGQPLDYLRGDMSPIICVAHCKARGFIMAGVENGQECWCGHTIRHDAVRIPESCCESPCQGASGALCGGEWAVGVFLMGDENDRFISKAYDYLGQ